MYFQQMNAEKEVEKTEAKLRRISSENAELKAKNKDFEEENQGLVKGMREIHQGIKEQGLYSKAVLLTCDVAECQKFFLELYMSLDICLKCFVSLIHDWPKKC